MTKEEAIKSLVKYLLLAIVVAIICMFASGQVGIMEFFAFFLVAGGIPAGWKWASTIITATSIVGIFIKLVIAIVLGWFALPYIVIKDIYYIVKNGNE